MTLKSGKQFIPEIPIENLCIFFCKDKIVLRSKRKNSLILLTLDAALLTDGWEERPR